MLSNLTALPLLAGGLTDIDWMLSLFTVILFVLFVLVLSKFAWGPLLSAIDEPEKSIRGAIEDSRKQNAEAAALLAQHKELVREIGAEREEIIKKATREAEEFRVDLMAKARSDGEDIVRRAKQQIEEAACRVVELRDDLRHVPPRRERFGVLAVGEAE